MSNIFHISIRISEGLLYFVSLYENTVQLLIDFKNGLQSNLPQSHFVHHETHMTSTGLEPGSPQWEAGD
jgi:hypothetical protein